MSSKSLSFIFLGFARLGAVIFACQLTRIFQSG
jgi:hypothetical protein